MVELKYDSGEHKLSVMLAGEIDHHSAAEMREKIDEAVCIFKPSELILDFSDVGFMDSSAVGLIMGRYKAVSYYGGKVKVHPGSDRSERLLSISGLRKIVEFI